jgi:Transposase DDE domain
MPISNQLLMSILAMDSYNRGYERGIRLTEAGASASRIGKTNCKVPIPVYSITYAFRNCIERCFNKLKCSRSFAARYDKTAASYLGFIHIIAARLPVKSLST